MSFPLFRLRDGVTPETGRPAPLPRSPSHEHSPPRPPSEAPSPGASRVGPLGEQVAGVSDCLPWGPAAQVSRLWGSRVGSKPARTSSSESPRGSGGPVHLHSPLGSAPAPAPPHLPPTVPPPKSTSSRQGPPTPALLLGNYVMGWTRRSVAPLFSTESPEAWSVVGASADTQDPQLRPSASCVRLRPDFPGIPDRGFVPAQASQGTAWPPTVSRTVTDKYRDGQVQALRVEGPARAHTASLGEPAGERGGRPQRAPLGLAVHRPVTRGTRF